MHSIRTGGMAPAVTGLAEALAKKGHEVHYFTRLGESQKRDDIVNGVHYHRCSFDHGWNIMDYCRNMSYSMLARIAEAEKGVGKFDVVHGHDWHIVDALHELKNKRKLVLTFHSTEFGRNGGEFGSWWEYIEISGKEWYGGYVADKITTVSHTMKNELMFLYQMPSAKITVLPNGIDPSYYRKNLDSGSVKERYGIHPLAPVIFFVGRLVRQKGADILVEAIPNVLRHRGDARFIIAGQGDMRGHLEYLAHASGSAHAVRFLGYISDEQRVDLFNACDIVAITSRNEPFGMVLLEAWSAAKPAVTTDVGGLAENIENFKDGIKVYMNPESVAWGINYSINDAEGLRRMGWSGRAKVDKEFAWPRISEKAEKVYDQLEG